MAKAPKGKAATAPFSPHIHAPKTVNRIMWDVVIALIPAAIASVYYFGTNSIRIILISVGTAVLAELIMNLITKRDITIMDGSAVITGLLFAFNLPPATPWYVIVIGSVFAIAIVKWAFGGLGHNIMNPALGARVFVLAAWSTVMVNNWSPPIQEFMAQGESFTQASRSILDAVSSASPLNSLKLVAEKGVETVSSATPMATDFYTYKQLWWGNIPGCIGETSAFALLLGFIYLVARRVVIPVVPVIYIGVVALLTWIFGGLPFGAGLFTGDPLYHILSGGLMLGALFMATDYVTSPMTIKGNLIFAVLLGILTTIIRLWGGYPEGVSYSIVLMNFFVPIIDRYSKPKIYGRSPETIKGGAA